MVIKALSSLRVQSSGAMRWVCCFILLLMILLRLLGPLNQNPQEKLSEADLKAHHP